MRSALFAFWGIVVAGLINRAADASPRQPPNIIIVLADDLGWSELGCYSNRFNETPNLDRLAAQGIRFTDAYAAAPVCSPTRAALLTGQYPARLHLTDYLKSDDRRFLSPACETLNKALARSGYNTGLVGKWHLNGDYAQKRGSPEQHGFDEVICSEQSDIGGGSYWHPYRFMTNVPARSPHEYLTDRLNQEALDFIDRHQAHPFFLYLAHYAPHTRLDAKPDKLAKYQARRQAGRTKNNPQLAGMLETIDDGVGQIVDRLQTLRLADNTVLIFLSDNGGERTVTDNFPLHAGKSFLYEGGIRVPFILRWPGHVAPGRVCNEPVITQDVFPTLLEIAGARSRARVVDGVSLMPLLRNKGNLKRDSLYWFYPLEQPHFLGGASAGAMRRDDYKLIEFLDTGKKELYNLRNDLGEEHDLAALMPQRVASLHQQFVRWQKQVGANVEPRTEPPRKN